MFTLVLTCSTCGAENPEGSRFCNACGAALAERGRSGEERRIVSVLFVDLVGFTSRAETLDPEDVRAILTPYYERVRDALQSFGGNVEKFIGDAVMGVFGAPTAYGDDPERAVRAAFAVRDWAEEEGLQVRIAVRGKTADGTRSVSATVRMFAFGRPARVAIPGEGTFVDQKSLTLAE